jgi:hypothetical protein
MEQLQLLDHKGGFMKQNPPSHDTLFSDYSSIFGQKQSLYGELVAILQ